MHFIPNLVYPKGKKSVVAWISVFHSLPPCLVPGVTLPFSGQLHDFFFLYFDRAAISVIEYILSLRIASLVCLREVQNIEFDPCCREI